MSPRFNSPSGPSRPTTGREALGAALVLLVVLLGLTAFFSFLASSRIVSPDEGYYGLAAKLTAEGDHPYQDFFYPQMPLLPYAYGLWIKLTGSSLIEQRWLSALCSVGIGVMVYLHSRRRLGMVYGLVAVLLFATSPLVFPWYPLLKTYALAVCMLFAAVFLLDTPLKAPWKLRWFLAGLCLGAAVGARLFFAAAVPVVLFHCWRARRGRADLAQQMLWLGGGMLISLLPAIYFLITEFDSFWFSNVGYHLDRSNMTPAAEQRRRYKVFQVLFGLTRGKTFHGVQLPILFYGGAAYLALVVARRRKPSLAFLAALALVVVSFLPAPAYLQYMAVAIPFLAVCSVELLAMVFSSSALKAGGGKRLVAMGMAGAVLLAYVAPLSSDVERYTETGAGISWIKNPRHAAEWRPEALADVSRFIDKHTRPSETVIALWPGYLLGCHARILPHLENNFGLNGAAALPLGEGARFHVMHPKELIEVVKARSVRTIVFFDKSIGERDLTRGRTHSVKAALVRAKYRLVGKVGRVRMYQRV